MCKPERGLCGCAVIQVKLVRRVRIREMGPAEPSDTFSCGLAFIQDQVKLQSPLTVNTRTEKVLEHMRGSKKF